MKSINSDKNLWSEMAVELLENREEYGFCFSCINCYNVCIDVGPCVGIPWYD